MADIDVVEKVGLKSTSWLMKALDHKIKNNKH